MSGVVDEREVKVQVCETSTKVGYTDRQRQRETQRGLRLFGDGLLVCQSLSDACLLEEEETGSDWLRLVGLK